MERPRDPYHDRDDGLRDRPQDAPADERDRQ